MSPFLCLKTNTMALTGSTIIRSDERINQAGEVFTPIGYVIKW